MRESHLQRLFFFSCQICADNRNSLHLLCPEMRAGSCSLILLGLQLWSSVSLFLLYLEIAVLALSDSALVLPIFAEPLTVVTSKVSNSKPALYINYQSHQKNLRIIKSERIWGNRPDRGTHVQRQPVSRQSKFVARMATLKMASGKDAENCRFLFYYLLPPPLLPTVNVNISKVVEVKRANLYSCNDMTLRFLNVVFSFRFTVLF